MIAVDGVASDAGDILSPDFSEEGGAVLTPDEDEASDEDNEEEGDDLYDGPPTTLLAEIQLRKQQQKLRTRPVLQAFPDGLHTTLLELDAVAEVERKTRKGKRVNLAWEDPAMKPETDDEDDEDIPLGVLYAAKVAGNNDISAVAAEMNRPLGLMEKKELEDNEPLSRRRDRLQGRDPGVSVYLGAGALGITARRGSTMALGQFNSNNPGDCNTGAGAGSAEEEEIEGETLAERLRRLKAKEESELPRARPVSGAFSAELLSQFGDPEEEAKSAREGAEKTKGGPSAKGKETAPPEEEETLGQRRRRLQAEKEAREKEMASSGGVLAVNGAALQALTGSRRLSMADVLTAHPVERVRAPVADPREAERLRRENEAARAARDKEAKMAAFRMQMQMPLAMAAGGGGLAKPGGFRGGLFNDGSGGGVPPGFNPAGGAGQDGPGFGVLAGGGARGAGNVGGGLVAQAGRVQNAGVGSWWWRVWATDADAYGHGHGHGNRYGGPAAHGV